MEKRDNKIKSTMIDLKLQDTHTSTLDDYIRTSEVLPLGVFFKSSLLQAIRDAISYLKLKKQGSVFIPSELTGVQPLQLVSSIDKYNNLKINYITNSYRYPLGNESRPITEDEWEVGDKIYNTNTELQKCIGWVCKEKGIPGKWGVMGFIRNWATEIEEVSHLPDPTIYQLNRQLVQNGRVYICKCVNGEYNWYWMDYAYGSTAERPTTDLRIGLPYFNTETGLPEWYNGKKWVEVALADQDWLDPLLNSMLDAIKDEFYKVFNIPRPDNVVLKLDSTPATESIITHQRISNSIMIRSEN